MELSDVSGHISLDLYLIQNIEDIHDQMKSRILCKLNINLSGNCDRN